MCLVSLVIFAASVQLTMATNRRWSMRLLVSNQPAFSLGQTPELSDEKRHFFPCKEYLFYLLTHHFFSIFCCQTTCSKSDKRDILKVNTSRIILTGNVPLEKKRKYRYNLCQKHPVKCLKIEYNQVEITAEPSGGWFIHCRRHLFIPLNWKNREMPVYSCKTTAST